MKKLDSRIRRTYANLTKALYELLQEKSFDNITVSQICEEAGVHRATFYKHFIDKYAFLRFYFEYQLEEIYAEKIATIDSGDETLKKRCLALLDHMLLFINDNRCVFTAFTDTDVSASFVTTVVDVFSNFIADKISTYCSEKGSKVDMLSHYYANAVVGLYSWWFSNENACTLEELKAFYDHKVDEMCKEILA